MRPDPSRDQIEFGFLDVETLQECLEGFLSGGWSREAAGKEASSVKLKVDDPGNGGHSAHRRHVDDKATKPSAKMRQERLGD